MSPVAIYAPGWRETKWILKFLVLGNNVKGEAWTPDLQALVVQTLDSAIHRIKIYPVDKAIGFPNTYPLDSDLSGR